MSGEPTLTGYPMPSPAPWLLRLPGVRHVRAMVLSFRINRHYDFWRSMGMMGGWTETEIAVWRAIKRGDL
jgi:hypothetical protein